MNWDSNLNDEIELVTIAASAYQEYTLDGHIIGGDGCRVLIRPHKYGLSIGFKGTDSASEWLSNLDCKQIASDIPIRGARVHKGFSDSLDTIWDELLLYINATAPGKPILLSGHSRGAAHATIAAARLIALEVPVLKLHTYGSPRVGNRKFSRYLEQHIGEARRYSFESDPVPRFPRFRYHHVGGLYWRYRGEWRHEAGFIRRLGAFLFARKWPFIGDPLNDHKISNYIKAIQ